MIKANAKDQFQSTPLIRGETELAETIGVSENFNPLPSYEGRPRRLLLDAMRPQFQSTPLIRGETTAPAKTRALGVVFVHSPQTRGDPDPDPLAL